MAQDLFFAEEDLTFFQIKPIWTEDRWVERITEVVFCNKAFDLNNVFTISEPWMAGKLSYKFSVQLTDNNGLHRLLEFEFEQKRDTLMAQRELTRAYCQYGEFAKPVQDTVQDSGGLDN